MTTARERYEAKTRVVTFRVSQKEYQQLEEVKAKTGQSNADLIILGAGIAREKRKAKLTEASELENRLAQLKAAIRETQRQVDRTLA
jgi:vacuolar-type H+-ATPase subunit I/STV1